MQGLPHRGDRDGADLTGCGLWLPGEGYEELSELRRATGRRPQVLERHNQKGDRTRDCQGSCPALSKTPPPSPLPEAERGSRTSVFSPSPLRGGGRGEGFSTQQVLSPF